MVASKAKPKAKPKPKVKQNQPKHHVHPGGRPPFYKSLPELQEKIDAYFESCWVDKVIETITKDGTCTMSTVRYQQRPYTVMGLVLGLGFTTRQALANYAAKPEFMDAIKGARSKIEMNVEELMLEGKNAAGPIFWLKNNAEEKYRDKTETEHTITSIEDVLRAIDGRKQ